MKQSELLQALDQTRQALLKAIEGLSEAEMEQPGVVGAWSVKEVLDHLTRWEAELVKLLWEASQGVRPTTVHFGKVDVDSVNAEWQKQSHTRPLGRVLADFHSVRKQTRLRVQSFRDAELTDPKHFPWSSGKALWEWIVGDSTDHESEHAAQILLWRNNRTT